MSSKYPKPSPYSFKFYIKISKLWHIVLARDNVLYCGLLRAIFHEKILDIIQISRKPASTYRSIQIWSVLEYSSKNTAETRYLKILGNPPMHLITVTYILFGINKCKSLVWYFDLGGLNFELNKWINHLLRPKTIGVRKHITDISFEVCIVFPLFISSYNYYWKKRPINIAT